MEGEDKIMGLLEGLWTVMVIVGLGTAALKSATGNFQGQVLALLWAIVAFQFVVYIRMSDKKD